MQAMAYVNWNRVIADCPGGCGNAYRVDPWVRTRRCDADPDGCGVEFDIVVASNMGEIMEELSRRPNDENKNWFPEGHPMALKHKEPHGQSVADLAAEFALAREGKL